LLGPAALSRLRVSLLLPLQTCLCNSRHMVAMITLRVLHFVCSSRCVQYFCVLYKKVSLILSRQSGTGHCRQKFLPLLWQQKDNRITVAALLLAAVEALIHQRSKIILLLPPPPASSSSLLLLLRGVLLLQYSIIQKLYSNVRLLHCTKYLLSLPSLYYSTIVHVILYTMLSNKIVHIAGALRSSSAINGKTTSRVLWTLPL